MSFDIDVIKTANVLCPSPAFCCLAPWIAPWPIGKISLEGVMHAAFKKPINWLMCHNKKNVCVLRKHHDAIVAR